MAVHKRYDRNVLGRGLDDIGNGRGLDALIDTGEVRTQGSSNLCEIPQQAYVKWASSNQSLFDRLKADNTR